MIRDCRYCRTSGKEKNLKDLMVDKKVYVKYGRHVKYGVLYRVAQVYF